MKLRTKHPVSSPSLSGLTVLCSGLPVAVYASHKGCPVGSQAVSSICKAPKVALLILVSALGGCSGENGENSSAGLQIEMPDPIRQAQAVDTTQVAVTVTINDNQVILAQRVGDGIWTVPGLRRSDYLPTNSIQFVWSEQVGSRSLLLAEFTGTFSLTDAVSIDPTGTFATSGDIRFDVDSDGISNLEERTSVPPTDPFGGDSGTPVANTPAMIDIAAGCFDMGSPVDEPERGLDEGPEFNVCVGAFKMSMFEITFAEYDFFARETARTLPDDEGWGRGTRPVVNVNWNDASAYASWLSNQTGRSFRLPTEAEWEYAALAGGNEIFHTGRTVTSDQANINGTISYNGSAIGVLISQTLPVGSYSANAFGLHDMHGNAWEWTCSIYSNPYSGAEQVCGSGAFSERSLRGGGWNSQPANARAANRSSDIPSFSFDAVGFRLAED